MKRILLALTAALALSASCGGGGAPSVQTAAPSTVRSVAPLAGTDDPGKTYPKASGSPSDHYGY
ncbi:MAG: hypothetical protein AUH85_01715 [Chloroflexi bacterium 13_1_40CM_4_68_4]|nr:MAG: hypothetical protein AUH85_01715 [Chloroflexi bacterium 13_1_40CM_4_68_4]